MNTADDTHTAAPLFRIAYIPFQLASNEYATRMREILSIHGVVSKFIKPKDLLIEWTSGRFKPYDLTIINWIENDIVSPRTGKVSLLGTVKVFLKTIYARCLSRKLAFVRHNIYPHHTIPSQGSRAESLLDRYERMFDHVFIHSGAHLANNRAYCPHPLYRLAGAKPGVLSPLPGVPENYFVMFGRVARYKCILELAKLFPADKNLLIIGAEDDKEYGHQIATLRKNNVFYRPGFLDEQRAQRIVTGSTAVLIAHAGDNTVVSGTFFYALSLSVPVVAVTTPFLKWVAPKVGEERLVLAENIDAMPSKLSSGDYRLRSSSQKNQQVEGEFGDAVIARALGIALHRATP